MCEVLKKITHTKLLCSIIGGPNARAATEGELQKCQHPRRGYQFITVRGLALLSALTL